MENNYTNGSALPSPADAPRYQTDAKYRENLDAYVALTAASTNAASHCESIWSAVLATSRRWEEYNVDLPDLQQDLESIWHHICLAGMTLMYTNTLEQQRLVSLVLAIKVQGAMTRNNPSNDAEVERGDWWMRLPLFETKLQQMLQAIFTNALNIDANEHLSYWNNLNSLAMRMSAAHAYDLRVCAVWAVRNALEDMEAINPLMMRVLVRWMEMYGFWLENIAVFQVVGRAYWDNTQQTLRTFAPTDFVVPLGRLAIDAGVTGEGLELSRWRFWRARLHGIADGGAHGDGIASVATIVLDRMVDL